MRSELQDEDDEYDILSGRVTKQKKTGNTELYNNRAPHYHSQQPPSHQAFGLAPCPAAQLAPPTRATSFPDNVPFFQAQTPSHNIGNFNRPGASGFAHSYPSNKHITAETPVAPLTNAEICAMVAQQMLSQQRRK